MGGFGADLFEQGAEGGGSVADLEAFVRGELGHGAVVLRDEDEGVVAETAGAFGVRQELADAGAVGGVVDAAVAGEGEDAAVAASAVGGFKGGELEGGVVVLIGRACGVFGAQVLREAGAADAGAVVEGGDFEAAVVGEDPGVGGEFAVVDGFQAGVGFEGVAGFVGRLDGGEIGKWFDLDGGVGGVGEVAELAGLVVAMRRSMGLTLTDESAAGEGEAAGEAVEAKRRMRGDGVRRG